MKLSIIIPVYNVENYIVDCLESIYKIKNEDFEVICIDDKGFDKSIDLIKKYVKQKNITNLKIITNKVNSGLSVSRNIGVKFSKGKYICFLDSDDMIIMDSLISMVETAIRNDLDIIEGKMNEILETDINIKLNNNTDDDIQEKILNGKDFLCNELKNKDYYPMACLRIYKRELLNVNDGFYPNIKFEDEEFTPRIIINANKVMRVSLEFYTYRRRNNSITTNMFEDMKWYNSYIIIINKLIELSKKEMNSMLSLNLENRAGEIALSLLKNPISYGASKEIINNVIDNVKKDKIYLIPLRCKKLFIKIQGIIMMFPNLFISLYRMGNK